MRFAGALAFFAVLGFLIGVGLTVAGIVQNSGATAVWGILAGFASILLGLIALLMLVLKVAEGADE